MDPIAGINIKKDSTFAMLMAAQQRGWQLFYMELADLYLRDSTAFARMRQLTVKNNPQGWFTFEADRVRPLAELDCILMRKDPPSTWSISIQPIYWSWPNVQGYWW